MSTTIQAPDSGKTTTLRYREGNSDKVYQASLEREREKWLVTFAYGRRGSTLSTGRKTPTPVEYEEAKRIHDKLVRDKMAKGYTPAPDGTPYQHTDRQERVTGVLPQLLNPVDYEEAMILTGDSAFCAQEKFDGKRILILRQGDDIVGINRKGLAVGLPVPIVDRARELEGDFLIDGECVADCFHAFDLLEWRLDDYRPETYKLRLCALLALLGSAPSPNIGMAETAYDEEEKVRLMQSLVSTKREGIVFKRLDAPYTPGRPTKGGPQLKCKFTASISAVVSKINTERSVEIQLHGANGWQSAGKVSIPVNRPFPEVGTILEIRYLYAFRQSGRLFQPVYSGVRNDLDAEDCTVSDLKFKSDDEEEV